MTVSRSVPPRPDRGPRATDVAVFVREFVRNPLRTASLVPSSRTLARAMTAPLTARGDLGRPPVVVELGPGTGVFTRELLGAHPGVRYLGLELNPVMIERLTARFPGLDVVAGNADRLGAVLAERGLDQVDLVVSGLPWQAWAGAAGARLADTVSGVLAPGGAFTQFTYSFSRWTAPAHRQHEQLRRSFGRVHRSGSVWQNVPPAVVYTATNPPTPAPHPR